MRGHIEKIVVYEPGGQASDVKNIRIQQIKNTVDPVFKNSLFPPPFTNPPPASALSPAEPLYYAEPNLIPHRLHLDLEANWPVALKFCSISGPQIYFLVFEFSLNFWFPFLYFVSHYYMF